MIPDPKKSSIFPSHDTFYSSMKEQQTLISVSLSFQLVWLLEAIRASTQPRNSLTQEASSNVCQLSWVRHLIIGSDTDTDKLGTFYFVHLPTLRANLCSQPLEGRDDKPPPFFSFLNREWYNGYNRINCFESNGVRLSTPLLSAPASCQFHATDTVTEFTDLLIR